MTDSRKGYVRMHTLQAVVLLIFGVIIGGAFSTIVSSLVNDIHQQAEEACTCCCADHKGLSVLQVRDTY